MKAICNELGLLKNDDGLVRVPLLVKGRVVTPPEVSKKRIEEAFSSLPDDATFVMLDRAQVVREPMIDRQTMRHTGDYFYQIMPVFDPAELIETDVDKLTRGLYSLPFSEVLGFLTKIKEALESGREVVDRSRDISRLVAEHPDPYHDAAFVSFPVLLDEGMARSMVDNELSAWGRPGSEFLDGWVEVDADVFPGLTSIIGAELITGDGPASPPPRIRAMPTRQLHITAGNAPAVPVVSALRAILTKSAAVIKSPYGATIPGALIGIAAAAAAPGHPITQNLSIVYWPGGEENIESAFFMPGAFDRIVVWGAPEAVASVQSRALFTRTVCFNPRYGFSMIGKEAFDGDLEEAAARAAKDTMIWNQKACIASQVHYVEGSDEQAEQYAQALCSKLAEWDRLAPNFVSPSVKGQLKRMKRGKYMSASWHLNKADAEFKSGVLLLTGEFDIMDHPMCRLVIVRRVDELNEVFRYLHHAVSTVGVFPEQRRLGMMDSMLARGVSNVLPLGQCERMFGGMPHDGMMVLSDLVDWKNG